METQLVESSKEKKELSKPEKKEQEKKELSKPEKECADRLVRNFLIVLVLAFAAEVAMRVFPDFLRDAAGQRQWLEWLLVSLIGVCTYLIWRIAYWYRRPDAQFISYRHWYRATAAKGPIVALVILMALTNISFQAELPTGEEAAELPTGEEATEAPAAFDFGIDFGQADESVLLVVAFLLGFYSRLAHDLLEKIAAFIFPGAYKKAYEEPEEPPKEEEGPAEGSGGGTG